MRTTRLLILTMAALALASSVWAQAAVTTADLTRLDNSAKAIAARLTDLRSTDPTLGADVEKSLAVLQDEIAYLRVKLRREEVVSRQEYSSLRDRLDTLRIRAGDTVVAAQPVLDAPVGRAWTVPVGTMLDVRLQTTLNSGTAKAEDRFEATTVLDFTMGNDVVIPAGTVIRGFVSSVRSAGRLDRKGSLTLSFDEIRFGNRSQRLRASITEAMDGKVSGDATRIGAGAVVGGIIGGLLGGGKGALVGVLVGGGGTIAATEGSDVELPVGTILRIRLDETLDIVRSGS